MTRREAVLSAVFVFLVTLAVRWYAATLVVFPKPEDTAYYVDVARNLLAGRGLVTDALWSFGTEPLIVPREAFEVWLPLPTFAAAVPMALFGATFAAAQVSSVLIGALVPVLAWRLGADVAAERGLPAGRARTLAIGTGLTAAVSLPLILHSTLPDSTMPFAALTLAACLLITRIRSAAEAGSFAGSHPTGGSDVPAPPEAVRDPEPVAGARPTGQTDAIPATPGPRPRESVTPARPTGARADRRPLAPLWLLVTLGAVLGLAALTRNEAAWLALAWAIVAWRLPLPVRDRVTFIAIPAAVALAFFAPWMIRNWLAFGSPLPGQALTNALSVQGTDIFAWSEPATLSRYLAVGPARLLEMRVVGVEHNLLDVLLVPGAPLSLIGLLALPLLARVRTLQPLVLVSSLIFLVTSLVFPVSTTWGTFLHAAGAVHVLLMISALLALDRLIAALGRRRAWTRPVAWLAPALTVSGAILFSALLLPSFGEGSAVTSRVLRDGAARLETVAVPADRGTPVLTDAPIWLPYVRGGTGLALPYEPPSSVLDLARHFGARTVALFSSDHPFRAAIATGTAQDAACFEDVTPPATLVLGGDDADTLRIYRVVCP